jgi:hypothetical protein
MNMKTCINLAREPEFGLVQALAVPMSGPDWCQIRPSVHTKPHRSQALTLLFLLRLEESGLAGAMASHLNYVIGPTQASQA